MASRALFSRAAIVVNPDNLFSPFYQCLEDFLTKGRLTYTDNTHSSISNYYR